MRAIRMAAAALLMTVSLAQSQKSPGAVSFSLGKFAEYGTCETHGRFARKLSEEQLVTVIDWCKSAEPINWVRAMEIALGVPGDNAQQYLRQPAEVRVYNPEALPLQKLLLVAAPVKDDGSEGTPQVLGFDFIETEGMTILIPYHYQITQGIISSCPKCEGPNLR
jgi:hypothetical protein